MTECSEFTVVYFDNQDDIWKRATIVAKGKAAAMRLIDEVIPLQRRTIYKNDEEQDTTEIKREARLYGDAYLVAIEPARKPTPNVALKSTSNVQIKQPKLRLVSV